MNQIALILNGETAKIFLRKILEEFHSSNLYYVICTHLEDIPSSYPNTFTFHHCDPTSPFKLKNSLPKDLDQIFVIDDCEEELQVILENLYTLYPKTPILCKTFKTSLPQDERLNQISAAQVLANHFMSYLLNTPKVAQEFGLGKGEIIEIIVPPGSVYCYRSLSSISQKEWRIVGIYRNDELLLSHFSLTIRPNDRLLAVGDPKILHNIYKQMTNSLGQFPIPFGKELFVYLDEDFLSENEILFEIENALYLQSKLNSQKLNIILNQPKSLELIQHLNALSSTEVCPYIHYDTSSLIDLIKLQNQRKIGLAIVHPKIFAETKKTFFTLGIPVLKTGTFPLKDCKQGIVLLEENMPNIASNVLDISSQLDLELQLWDFDVDGIPHTKEQEDYEDVAKVFSKKIIYTQHSQHNPVFLLKDSQEPHIQFLPFLPNTISDSFFEFISTSLSAHSTHFHQHHQILIPIPYENN